MDQPQKLATSVAFDTIRIFHEVDFYGVIPTTQVFLPLILTAPPGYRAILLNSMHTGSNAWMAAKDQPNAGLHFVAYDTSKAAANSYMIALAPELKDKDVEVNAVAPRFVATKLNGFALGGKTPEAGEQALLQYSLLGPKESEITSEWPLKFLLGKETNTIQIKFLTRPERSLDSGGESARFGEDSTF